MEDKEKLDVDIEIGDKLGKIFIAALLLAATNMKPPVLGRSGGYLLFPLPKSAVFPVPPRTFSFYARPSLQQMEADRAANRARVYDFLGIFPDELDGLELLVTIDVMRKRVDFLHSLGLTVDDINNYLLVLGCSVKENMVPVSDYIGKLGVHKATFTEFLQRYPQVLHYSVVDLMPVVKNLQGIDIRPVDIPPGP